jgi:hypothetical protein
MYQELAVPVPMTWEIYGDKEARYEDCFRMFNPLTRDGYDATVKKWSAGVLALAGLLPQHPALPLREAEAAAKAEEKETRQRRKRGKKKGGGVGGDDFDPVDDLALDGVVRAEMLEEDDEREAGLGVGVPFSGGPQQQQQQQQPLDQPKQHLDSVQPVVSVQGQRGVALVEPPGEEHLHPMWWGSAVGAGGVLGLLAFFKVGLRGRGSSRNGGVKKARIGSSRLAPV